MKGYFTTKKITFLAILIAIVILFQVFGSYIKIGATNFSLVLVPIVLGGILLGELAGLILGFVFSLTVFLMGLVGADVFTNYLIMNAPIQTVILIFAKGCLAGYIPALAYKFISKKNSYLATFISSVLAPVINTGLFILLAALLLKNTLVAGDFTDADGIMYFLIIGCAGINFIVELIINIVLAPVVKRVAGIVIKGEDQ